MGWLAEQIVLVDVDLGVSGRFGSERDGYRQIVARLCMGEVPDIADGVAYMVTRPRHTAISELWIMPTDQA